jgi:peptide/nickel transport system permease protein
MIQEFQRQFGLDQPIHIRYVDWLSHFIRGDFGLSYRNRADISKMIGEALPKTITISIFSLIVSTMIAIPAGIISALKRDRLPDLIVSIGCFLGVSIPGFWLGLMMLYVFSVQLGWLPAAGYVSFLKDPVEGIRHILMPSTMLGVILAAYVARMTRSSLLEVLREDYIRTARSKGLAERVVVYKHALKNALIPVVTVIGFQFGGLLGGSVITETIFTIQGMGMLMYWGVLDRDYPIVQACATILIIVYIVVNFAVDLLYMYLNPRMRYE